MKEDVLVLELFVILEMITHDHENFSAETSPLGARTREEHGSSKTAQLRSRAAVSQGSQLQVARQAAGCAQLKGFGAHQSQDADAVLKKEFGIILGMF